MIACDNEGGCPFEWVCFQAFFIPAILTRAYLVPSVLRGYETTYPGEVVLLRVYSEHRQEKYRGCCRQKGQKEIEACSCMCYVYFLQCSCNEVYYTNSIDILFINIECGTIRRGEAPTINRPCSQLFSAPTVPPQHFPHNPPST